MQTMMQGLAFMNGIRWSDATMALLLPALVTLRRFFITLRQYDDLQIGWAYLLSMH